MIKLEGMELSWIHIRLTAEMIAHNFEHIIQEVCSFFYLSLKLSSVIESNH